MAKQVIVSYVCDACGKEASERYLVKFGKGSWDIDEEMDVQETRDLCKECYDQLIDLIDAGKGKDVRKTQSKPKPTSTEKRSTGIIDDKFIEMYEDGRSYADMCKELDLTLNQVRGGCNRLRKKGYIRGVTKKMGKPEIKNYGMKTTVDKDGFVLSIS